MKYNHPDSGLVFNVQRFSVHDGPGIRTVVFFKGCPLHCFWCQNPESIKPHPEIAYYHNKCIKCGDCIPICPEKCLDTAVEELIDREKCTVCLKCADTCSYESLKTVGKWYSPRDLLAKVERDRVFFEDSGGGITLSGGEPTLQNKFLEPFLHLCKNSGLNVTMETCGYFDYDDISAVLKKLDCILFDLKIMDETSHIEFTGKSNKIILQNLARMISENILVIPRVPLVSGMTMDDRNVEEIIKILDALHLHTVHLLPYHSLGESKRRPLGEPPHPKKIIPPGRIGIEVIRHRFQAAGFTALVI